jgi:hypothetical protein
MRNCFYPSSCVLSNQICQSFQWLQGSVVFALHLKFLHSLSRLNSQSYHAATSFVKTIFFTNTTSLWAITVHYQCLKLLALYSSLLALCQSYGRLVQTPNLLKIYIISFRSYWHHGTVEITVIQSYTHNIATKSNYPLSGIKPQVSHDVVILWLIILPLRPFTLKPSIRNNHYLS